MMKKGGRGYKKKKKKKGRFSPGRPTGGEGRG